MSDQELTRRPKGRPKGSAQSPAAKQAAAERAAARAKELTALALQVREIRRNLGLTQQAMADELQKRGVHATRQLVALWEAGPLTAKASRPSDEAMAALLALRDGEGRGEGKVG